MALQNKLKAFVRFDGSGRVIPSSLILQKSKPKVGNWKEINATQCCNGSSTTTTTTTTADLRPRISSTACGPLLPYQEITIMNGDSICDNMIYIDGDFLQLSSPFYVNVGSTYRQFSAMGNQAFPSGGCVSCVPGTTVFTKSYWLNSSDACSTTVFGELLFYSGSSMFAAGISVFQDAELTIPVTEGIVFSDSMFKYIVGANGLLSSFECSTTTTSTTTSSIFPISVYIQSGSSNSQLCPQGSTGTGTGTIYATTPILQAGTRAFSDQNGTTPLSSGGFSYKQVGYDTVWYPIYSDGFLYQECINSGVQTGKFTNNVSTPCSGAGTDISFTSIYGVALGYGGIFVDGTTFSALGLTTGTEFRILQTGENVWYSYIVQGDTYATPKESTYSPVNC